MRWWGWGDPGPPTGAASARARLPPRARGGSPSPAPAGRTRRACGLRPSALSEQTLADAACDRRRRGRPRRSRTNASSMPQARAIPISCGCAPESPRARRTRWSIRRAMTQVRARPDALRAGLARGGALRGRHERRRRRGAAARRARRRAGARHAAHGRGAASSTASRGRSPSRRGMRAPALERYLAARGLTLGHFPQSFEYVSLGGCAATGRPARRRGLRARSSG